MSVVSVVLRTLFMSNLHIKHRMNSNDRTSDFTIFIQQLMKTFLADNVIKILCTKYFTELTASFTSKNYDQVYNYEFFEIIGDLSINKFIVNYMCKRFPQLKSSDGVAVLATLKMYYGSKNVLSSLAENLSFDKHVRATKKDVLDKNNYVSILEDVFEAFCGVVEFSLDKEFGIGVGYAAVHKFLENVFEKIDISIDYDNLVDDKTKLNELKIEHKLVLKYKTTFGEDGFTTHILFDHNKIVIGVGRSDIKKTAETLASTNALKWLKENLNIVKEVPDKFKFLQRKIW